MGSYFKRMFAPASMRSRINKGKKNRKSSSNAAMEREEQLIPCVPWPNRRRPGASILFVRSNKWRQTMANWSEGPLLGYGLPSGGLSGAEVPARGNKDIHPHTHI